MVQLLSLFSDEMAEVAAKSRRTLVQIVGDRGNLGAGTIWHTDGLIVTNAHVIMGSAVRVVLPNGEEHPATVIAADRHQDIAALAINASGLPTIGIGNSNLLKPGHWVMALGHPWGVRDSLSVGTVIGVGDQLPELAQGRQWIALDIRLRPGHSGGPLVNVDGDLVGINTMITAPEVGFAIPVNTVKTFLKQAINLQTPEPVLV